MIFLRLTRKTGDQRGPKTDIRNLLPQPVDDPLQLRPVCPASHSLKDSVGSVLDRQIQIMADLLLLPDRLDQCIVDFLRIAV